MRGCYFKPGRVNLLRELKRKQQVKNLREFLGVLFYSMHIEHTVESFEDDIIRSLLHYAEANRPRLARRSKSWQTHSNERDHVDTLLPNVGTTVRVYVENAMWMGHDTLGNIRGFGSRIRKHPIQDSIFSCSLFQRSLRLSCRFHHC